MRQGCATAPAAELQLHGELWVTGCKIVITADKPRLEEYLTTHQVSKVFDLTPTGIN